VAKEETTDHRWRGRPKTIEARVKNIRQRRFEEATSDYDKEKLAGAPGGEARRRVAVIKGSVPAEVEMKEKKARVEDALHATRAAVEEGIVAGGGVAYIRARTALDKLKGDNPDQDAGIKIIMRALEEPLRQIVANSGAEPSVVMNKIAEGKGNFGFNAQTEQFGDMVEMGVSRSDQGIAHALQNAASVAGLLAYHRGNGGGARRGQEECRWRPRSRHGWNGRHGRHGYVTRVGGFDAKSPAPAGLFFGDASTKALLH